MNIFLLIVAIITLLAVLKRITLIEKISAKSMTKEIIKNTQIMLWGILLVFCIFLFHIKYGF